MLNKLAHFGGQGTEDAKITVFDPPHAQVMARGSRSPGATVLVNRSKRQSAMLGVEDVPHIATESSCHQKRRVVREEGEREDGECVSGLRTYSDSVAIHTKRGQREETG